MLKNINNEPKMVEIFDIFSFLFDILIKLIKFSFFGAVAQLVERMDGIHEATGSTPVSSTLRFGVKLCS